MIYQRVTAADVAAGLKMKSARNSHRHFLALPTATSALHISPSKYLLPIFAAFKLPLRLGTLGSSRFYITSLTLVVVSHLKN